MPISDARDHLADVVNRAVYGGTVTHLTRCGRRLAAIVSSAQLAAELRKLDRPVAALIRKATEALRPSHGAKVLAGRRGQLRIRVGDYRVIYTVQDDRLVALLLEVGHRRDVYEL
jgi:mRNA interferase RelE/StbE